MPDSSDSVRDWIKGKLANLLLIRVDASSRIGAGHVMRCLGLAQAWRALSDHPVMMAAAEMPDSLMQRIEAEGISIRALANASSTDELVRVADRVSATHVVLDGYHLGDQFEQSLAAHGLVVLSMDDFGHSRHRWAHIVVNQNLHADQIDYSERGTATRLLLGPQYVLLRREFWEWRDRPRRRREPVRRLLVTTGGGDASWFAERALEATKELPVETRLILGASNSRANMLERHANAMGVQVVVDALDMPHQMDAADLALAAAGSTCWELLFMGVPALVVALAENQRAIACSLQDAGAARSLGWHEDVEPYTIRAALERLLSDSNSREAFSARGPALVDGRGAERVARVLKDYGRSPQLRIRPATPEDEHYVWRVNNQPSARRTAIHTEDIPFETHVAWFERSLRDRDRMLLIAMSDDTPVGVVRFDRDADTADISVALDAGYQGRGLGTKIIAIATRHCCAIWPLARVNAYVRPDNLASKKAFTKAGFTPAGPAYVRGVELETFAYEAGITRPRA